MPQASDSEPRCKSYSSIQSKAVGLLNQSQGEMRIRRIAGEPGGTDFNVRTGELYLAALTCPHHLGNVVPTLALVWLYSLCKHGLILSHVEQLAQSILRQTANRLRQHRARLQHPLRGGCTPALLLGTTRNTQQKTKRPGAPSGKPHARCRDLGPWPDRSS